MKKRYLKSSCLFVLVLMILAVILPAGVFAQPEVKSTAATGDDAVIGVSYRGHVQNLGNMPTPEGTMIAGPEALGTTGKGLRLEGFWIDLTGDVPANAGIRYQVHVQNVGWQDAVDNGDFAGTKGRGLRIEAIKITLENLPDYDVYYRGHVQNVGNIPQSDGNWGWVKNGAELGTTGKGLRLEELQIKIVRKGVDLTAYNTLLGTIEKLDAANYSPESWAVLQTALTQNQMTEANSQTRIDAATQAIQAAYDGLSLKVLAVYDKPGIYGPETGTQTIEGSVVIAVSGVTLQNLVIKGDLTVAEAVGDGNANLKNLTVAGATILAGGGTGGAALAALATSGEEILTQGSGGITIDGGFLNKVLIKKNDHGGIRITIIDSFLESFEVIDIPEGQPIILSGAFKDVMVQAPDINLELATGTTVMRLIAGINDPQKSASGLVVSGGGFIDRFEVGELSDNVSVGQNVSILHAIIEGDNAQFNGNVTDANITGDNAGFRYPPLGYIGNPPVIINPPAPSPGGGGGGGGGSSTTPLAKVTNVVLSVTGVASWDNVDNESSFDVQLYKGGLAQGAVVNVPANTLTANFLSAMRSAGAGAYTVKVSAKGNGVAYSDGAVSDASSAQNVIQLATVNTGLNWSGDVAHWSTVTDAVSYDVQLYKDNVVLGSVVNVPAADAATGTNFASAIAAGGTGTYTYEVTAKGNAGLILDAAESDKSNDNVKALAPALGGGFSFADDDGSDNKTVINLSAPSVTGNTFVYKISDDANAVATPFVGEVLNTWTVVTNGGTITAANGKHIGVAEVDAEGKAVRFSDATAVTEVELTLTPVLKHGVSFADDDANDNKTVITLGAPSVFGNTFVYKISEDANAVAAPTVGDTLGSAWITVINGDSIITENGKHIGVAEVNTEGNVVQFSDAVAVTEMDVGNTASGLTVTAGAINSPSVTIELSETASGNSRGFLYHVWNEQNQPTAPKVGDTIYSMDGWSDFNTPTMDVNATTSQFVEVVEVDYTNGNSIIHWGYVQIP